MATYEQVTYNSPDGAQIGKSTSEKLAFYGSTPVTQQSVTVTTITSTNAVSTTSNIWGFSTSTQANQIVTAVNEILAALKNLGLASS